MDEVNNRIAILELLETTLDGVEELAGGVIVGQTIRANPPQDWTANIMFLADPSDEYQNDTGNDRGWDVPTRNAPVPVLELNTLTLHVEICKAGAGRMKEIMRVEAAVVKALHAAGWSDVCFKSKRDGTAWDYPDAGSSTSYTFCAIQWVVEWFSGRGGLAYQPVR